MVKRLAQQDTLFGTACSAAVALGLLAFSGCGHPVQKLEFTRPTEYQSEFGKKITLDETPKEVQDFIHASYPDARVDHIYEMTHSPKMRHFEIYLVLAGDRKKIIHYNFFPPKNGIQVKEIPAREPSDVPAGKRF